MTPKAPIVLGVLCVAVLIAGIIGVNSSKEFSEFMNSTTLQNKVKTDSKILFEINELALKYQEINEDQKINEQRVLMEEKIVEIARDSFKADNITQIEILPVYFPIVKGSQVDMKGNEKTFPICDVAENIPIHLQKITDAEMFQMFLKKYSKNELILNIQDERFSNSAFHYGLQAISDDGKFVASTFFHADSCTNEITDFDKFHLSCLDKEKREWTGGTTNPDYIRASLELEEFCTIPLSPWHQLVSDYQDTIREKIDEKHDKMSDVEIKSLEDATRFQSEMEQWVLLSNIAGNIVQNYLEDEKTQDMIREYNEKYGNLPDELLNLLDVKPLSSPESAKYEKYSQTLFEINKIGLEYKKNNDSEKFNEQILLMQEKQQEIASDILGVKISDVYIDKDWNFPFRNASDIEPFPNEEQTFPICDIPKNTPTHLEKIRDSDMFSMFSEKYSKNDIEFEMYDERNYNSIIHYSIRAISEDQNRSAGIFFHVDSCTGKISVPYNLDCRDNISLQDEGIRNQLQTRFVDEIQSSLDSEEFCVIELEPWHQKMREYHADIGEQIQQIVVGFGESGKNEDINQEDAFRLDLEFQRLGLLNDLVRSATSGTMEDEDTPELIAEYIKKYNELPDDLKLLLEMKEQHFSSL